MASPNATEIDDFEDVEDYSNTSGANKNNYDDANLHNHSLPTPEEVKLHGRSSYTDGTRRLRIMFCLICGCVLFAVGVIIATSTKGKKYSSGYNAVPNVTEALHQIAVGGPDDFADEESYQYAAYSRIVNDKSVQGAYEYERLKQRYAMYCLFHSANQDRTWKGNKGWKRMGMDECKWYGVMCDEEGWVTRIGLKNNGLSGEVPVEVSLIPKLGTFNVNQNDKLTGHIPQEICNIQQYRELHVKADCTTVECSCCENCSS